MQEDINIIHKASNFEEAIAELHKKFDPLEINKDAVKNTVHYQGLGRFLKISFISYSLVNHGKQTLMYRLSFLTLKIFGFQFLLKEDISVS